MLPINTNKTNKGHLKSSNFAKYLKTTPRYLLYGKN